MDLMFDNDTGCFEVRVAGIILNGDKILLETCDEVDFWSPPGGKLKFGESFSEALTRELQEELGEKCEVKELIWITEGFFDYKGRPTHALIPYLLANLPLNSHYHKQLIFERRDAAHIGTLMTFRWFSFVELQEINVKPEFLKEKILSLSGKIEHITCKPSSLCEGLKKYPLDI